MSELGEKVEKAIERIKVFENSAKRHGDGNGYYLAFSGGKDSVVTKALMDMAGVSYDAHYRVTSVDPPELVHFIKDKYPDVEFSYPKYPDGTRITMWNLIAKRMTPPLRISRYCCSDLKEDGGDGRFTVTGVRWAESVNRSKNHGEVTLMDKKAGKDLADNPDFKQTRQGGVVLVNDNSDSRQVIDACVTRYKTVLNPIIDWTDNEVWEFIRAENIPYCGLYDEGFHRLGCIGCPMGRRHQREQQFLRWPKYKRAYLRAFDKMLKVREEKNMPWRGGNTAMDVFNLWMEYDILPGQIDLLEEMDTDDETT